MAQCEWKCFAKKVWPEVPVLNNLFHRKDGFFFKFFQLEDSLEVLSVYLELPDQKPVAVTMEQSGPDCHRESASLAFITAPTHLRKIKMLCPLTELPEHHQGHKDGGHCPIMIHRYHRTKVRIHTSCNVVFSRLQPLPFYWSQLEN